MEHRVGLFQHQQQPQLHQSLHQHQQQQRQEPVDQTDHEAEEEEEEEDGAIWKELVEGSVECEVCNEPYGEDEPHLPRLLTCGHTFCQRCLEDWAATTAVAAANSAASSFSSNASSGSSASSSASSALGDFASMASAASRYAFLGGGGGNHHTNTYHNTNSCSIECPTCRRPTVLNDATFGIRGLPKNFDLLRVRQEIEEQTQAKMMDLKAKWFDQVAQKAKMAQQAQQNALLAQQQSEEACQRAEFLAKQVEINEQEKQRAQEVAQEAKHRALLASQKAEELRVETQQLRKRLQEETMELARAQHDATNAAAAAAKLETKAELLQRQVDQVRAQLSLHSGKHDPSRLVVLVCEPHTVKGSWLLPYTRYAVVSITPGTQTNSLDTLSIDDALRVSPTSSGGGSGSCCSTSSSVNGSSQLSNPNNSSQDAANSAAAFQAIRNYIRMHQVEEPHAFVKVYRRYSDFLWLYEELVRDYPMEFVPSLPGKRFFVWQPTEKFVGERMRFLQAFLREILRHPRLSLSDHVRVFLLSTTEELEKIKVKSSQQAEAQIEATVEEEMQALGCEIGGRHVLFGKELTPGAKIPRKSSKTSPRMSHAASETSLGGHPRRSPSRSDSMNGHMTNSSSASSLSGVKETSQWAWQAMTSWTSSAARLVGAASPPKGAMNGGSLPPVAPQAKPNSVHQPGKKASTTELMTKYHTLVERGSELCRRQRKQALHLHRMCELFADMDALDQEYAGKRRLRVQLEHAKQHGHGLNGNFGFDGLLDEEPGGGAHGTDRFDSGLADSTFELRSFVAKASEVFSAMSLTTRHQAEGMEFALLEAARMMILHFSSIEETLERLDRYRQVAHKAHARVLELQQQQQLAAENANMSWSRSAASQALEEQKLAEAVTKAQALAFNRQQQVEAFEQQVNASKRLQMDMARASYVLANFQQNVEEMTRFTSEHTRTLEANCQQLLSTLDSV